MFLRIAWRVFACQKLNLGWTVIRCPTWSAEFELLLFIWISLDWWSYLSSLLLVLFMVLRSHLFDFFTLSYDCLAFLFKSKNFIRLWCHTRIRVSITRLGARVLFKNSFWNFTSKSLNLGLSVQWILRNNFPIMRPLLNWAWRDIFWNWRYILGNCHDFNVRFWFPLIANVFRLISVDALSFCYSHRSLQGPNLTMSPSVYPRMWRILWLK